MEALLREDDDVVQHRQLTRKMFDDLKVWRRGRAHEKGKGYEADDSQGAGGGINLPRCASPPHPTHRQHLPSSTPAHPSTLTPTHNPAHNINSSMACSVAWHDSLMCRHSGHAGMA
eukprot:354502-Chlamydomonas_euryale.AAC.1